MEQPSCFSGGKGLPLKSNEKVAHASDESTFLVHLQCRIGSLTGFCG